MFRSKILNLRSVILVLIGLILPLVVEAQVELIPECALSKEGKCSVNDIVQMFVSFTRFLLGFVGAAVLLMLVYGGFLWLASGGNLDWVKKGQSVVKNAIIGLVIVFGSYTIVQFIFTGFNVKKEFQIGQECFEQNKRGIWVPDPDNPKTAQCVSKCGDPILKKAGYDCLDPGSTGGSNCIPGLCPGGENNMCCQSPP